MPPSLLLAVLLLVPSAWSIANKRHVAGGSSYSNSGASSFASSAAYSSGSSYSGAGGVKGGCGGCGQSGQSGFGSAAASHPGSASFSGGFGSGNGGSASSFVSAGNPGGFPGGQDLADVAFWWAGADSPFKKAQEFYKRCALKGDCGSPPGPIKIPGFDPNSSPCGPQGCVSKVPDNQPIDISKNPFLNGEYKGIAVSSCSGAGCPGGKPSVTVTNCKGTQCNTFKHEGEPQQIDFSNNPFLSGIAGGSSFKGSHGAGSDIAHSKNTAYGSESGQDSRPTPQSQTGQTTSYQHGTTSYGTSSSSSNSFAQGQTYPTVPSNTGSFSFGTGSSGSFGHSGIGQSGPGCGYGGNCQQVPSKEITPPPSGHQNNKPGCYPGQPGCQNGGSLPGSYPPEQNPSESDYQPGKQCYPGQPGCDSGKPQSNPTCYPGQPGCSRPQEKPQPGSYQPEKQCYPGQPGCEQNQPQTIPTCYPGQPGCSRTPEKPQPIPTCYPGQAGCSQQGSYPEQKREPVPPCYPGQPGCSSSSTLTSRPAYTTTFPNSGSSFSSSSSASNSYSGGSSSPGSYPGQFGQPEPEGELTLKCGGADYFCVEKYLCNNGIMNTNGEELLQQRMGDRYCNVKTEVCCRLIRKQPEQQQPNYYHSSQSTSGASASAGATTYFTSGPNPGPTIASQIANQYTPQHSHQPDSRFAQPNQPGLLHIPPKDAKPGQSIPFGGSQGNSPGVIHVVQDSSSPRPFTSGSFGNNPQQNQPGVQVRPHGEAEIPRPFTSGPGFVQVSHNGGSPRPNDFINELGSATAAATLRGPAYLPPDASPTPTTYTDDLLPPVSPNIPSPSSISPNVLIPQRPSTPRVIYTPPTTQRVIYTPPTTPKVYYSPQPTTPRPTFYQPTTPRKEYIPPQYPSGTSDTNVYLPPAGTSIVSTAIPPRTTPQRPYSPHVPDSNVININILKPPTDPPLRPIRPTDTPLRPEGAGTTEYRLRPPTSPRPTEFSFKGDLNTTPYPGCPAALKCVEAQYCTADAVISPVPVILTREQEIMRQPTTECADPETGIIGRCCRDPNYKDPWPASQLGLYNPNDGFDNGQYKETRTEGRYKKPPVTGVKGGPQPGVKGRPQSRPYEPNQLGAASNIPGTFVRPDQGYPSQAPNIPFDSRQVSRPVQVDVKNPIEYQFNGKQPYSPSKISSQTCGARRPGGSPRGQAPNDVDFAEIPWQAMILRDSNRSLLCGGAIIRRDAVLTAASCVEGLHSDDILVKGGEWKLGIDEEPKPFQIIKTAAIVRHPGYNPQTKLNDVAILVLSEKFRIDRNVDTICLPAPNTDVESTFKEAKCITTGWGKTILQLHLLNALMHSLDVGVVPAAQCQQTLQQYHSTSAQYYNTNCLCGATTQPNKDICDVDIGSALACDLGDGRYTLAGVYSWDTGCRSQSQLAGYTKVDTLWIESTLQRPLNDLKIEENGFYQRLSNPHQHTGPECHCKNGKK